MANITKIRVNGTDYNVKDSGALHSISAATSSSYGGVKIGYSGAQCPLKLDSNGRAYIDKPSAALPIYGDDQLVLRSYGASEESYVEIEGNCVYFSDDSGGRSLYYSNVKNLLDHEVKYYSSSANPYNCPAMNNGQIFIIYLTASTKKIKLPSGGFYVARELLRYDEGDYGSGGTTLTFGSSYIMLVRVY